VLVLSAFQGLINAFDTPARQAFVVEMVDAREDLANAIALNSSMVNGARLIGPVVAAALVDLFGEGWCFAIDAASYIAVIAALLAMTVKPEVKTARKSHWWTEMKDGVSYVRQVPLVRAVLLLLAVTAVLGGSYSTLLPMVAGSTLRGGPHTLGILMASGGCGALCGALYLASRSSVLGLGGVIGRVTLGLGLALVALRFAPNVYVAAPIVFVNGMTWMVQMAATNTIVQTIVDPDKLGRVMSLYAVAFFAGMPVGGLIEGAVADGIGPMNTFLGAGVAVIAAALVFQRALPGLRALSRPLYLQLGLIEE